MPRDKVTAFAPGNNHGSIWPAPNKNPRRFWAQRCRSCGGLSGVPWAAAVCGPAGCPACRSALLFLSLGPEIPARVLCPAPGTGGSREPSVCAHASLPRLHFTASKLEAEDKSKVKVMCGVTRNLRAEGGDTVSR